jgi:hypothetical protein
MVFNRTLQYFAHADDVKLVTRHSKKLEDAFQQLEKASEKATLKINGTITKYMINARNKVRLLNTENLKIGNYTAQRVNEFKYLGVLVTENSKIKSEIKTRNTAENRCYHAFIKLLKSTVISRKTILFIRHN